MTHDPVKAVIDALKADPNISPAFKDRLHAADKTHREFQELPWSNNQLAAAHKLLADADALLHAANSVIAEQSATIAKCHAALVLAEKSMCDHNQDKARSCDWDFGETFGGTLDVIHVAILLCEGRAP